MKEAALVSIITPVYNAERFIQQTLDSVQQQTYQNWEHILVDDCSQDRSVEIIERASQADPRIKLIHLAENSGAAVARNRGLEAAQGSYIAFIDSDDQWLADKLSQQIQFMEDHNYVFTYTDLALVDEAGQIIKESVGVPEHLSYHDLLKNTAIACSTVVINRQAVGDFRMPLVRKGQDTATWLMLMRERKLVAHGLRKVLNHYRQVANSISANKWGALKRTWNTYYNLEKLGLAKSIYYFSHYVLNAIRRRL